MVELKVDYCSYNAAKYACEHWHYSRTIPVGKLVKIGVWEDKQFIGCVLFGDGLNYDKKLGLNYKEICELVRVALKPHKSEVTHILSKSIKLLKKYSKNLKLIVSYADSNQSHLGIIYQAGNWIYSGESKSGFLYKDKNGKLHHPRRVNERGYVVGFRGKQNKCIKPSECIKIPQKNKFRYYYPLTKKIRKQILSLSKPYPKRL